VPDALLPQKRAAKVLIIDNDEGVRESLTALLEDDGYSVVVACDGAAGLAVLRDGCRPSVILLDLSMPVMDGWDFRAAQLREPALADIPVVVMSAAGFSVPTVTMQFGDVGVISKPVAIPALLAAVELACARVRASPVPASPAWRADRR
jgi:CheY-like chemotaxis protein